MPITSLREAHEKLVEKRILFVSGKGGVGKSLISAALAKELAAQGKKVLLAEIGETSYFKDFWGLKQEITQNPIKHPTEKFDLALWSGETSLREYVLFYLKMERLYNLFFENKVMRALVNVAPGLSEISILGKVTSGIRKVGPPMNYDVIVVDSYATGHALALLEAPKGMMEAIKFGPMGAHSREMDAVIRNERLIAYIIVTLLEELPVTEAMEFRDKLVKDFKVNPLFVANKVMHAPVTGHEIGEAAQSSNKGLAEFARHLEGVNDRQRKYSEVLKSSGARVVEVPLIFAADPSELVAKAGEALRAL